MTEESAQKQTKGQNLKHGSVNILITLLVILLPLILYVFYIEKQESYFKSYYHRTLGNINQEVTTRLDYLKLPMSRWLSGNTEPNKNEWLKSFKKGECAPIYQSPNEGGRYDMTKGKVTAKLSREKNDIFAIQVMSITSEELSKLPNIQQKNKGEKPLEETLQEGTRPCKAEIPVTDLVTTKNNALLFDTLLISNKVGDVIYEEKHARPQLLKLTPSNNFIFSFNEENKQKNTTDLKSTIIPSTFSISEGGNQYEVFCQIMNSSFFTNKKELKQPLFICGLVKADKFSRQVKSISANKVVIAIGGLLFILLLTPFLKLWLISPNDSYRQFDQKILRLSFYILVSLISIGILDSLRYKTLNEQLSDAMWKISQGISSDFKKELHKSVKILNKYDQCIKDKVLNVKASECSEKIKKEDALLDEINNTFNNYPAFEALGSVDYNGSIIVEEEISIRIKKLGGGSVSHRNYFQYAKYGPRLNKTICGGILSNGCVLERIVSMEEGVKLTAFSTLSEPIDRIASKPTIRALFKRLETFISPVLPDSIQFAVVQNTDGKVLFHSDDRLSLVENFFDEIDNKSLMQEIKNLVVQDDYVLIHPEKTFNGMYHGIEHSFVIYPLSIPDWTLVLFRDLTPLQTMNAEIVITSFIGIFLFLILLAVVVLFSQFFYEHPVGTWIWPNIKNSENRKRYFSILVFFGFLSLINIIILSHDIYGKQQMLLVFTLAILSMTSLSLLTPERRYQQDRLRNKICKVLPVLSFIIFMIIFANLIYQNSDKSDNRLIFFGYLSTFFFLLGFYVWKNKQAIISKQKSLLNLHVLFALFYFIALSIMPAWAIFESAWVINMEAYTRSSLTDYSRSLDLRNQAILKDVRRIRTDSKITDFKRSNYKVPWIDLSEYQKDSKPSHESQHLGQKIVDFIPILNSESAKLRTFYGSHGQKVGKPGDNWSWSEEFSLVRNSDVKSIQGSLIVDKKTQSLSGDLDKLPISMRSWLTKLDSLSQFVVFIIFFLWIYVLWLALKKICNQIFSFEQVLPAKRLQVNNCNDSDSWGWWAGSGINRLIIRPIFNVGEKLTELYEKHERSSEVKIIDLSREYHQQEKDESIDYPLSAEEIKNYQVFVLENFESILRDPEVVKRIMHLLLELSKYDNKIIHIVSQVDLPHCLQIYFRNHSDVNILSTADEKNWIKILSKFHKAHSDHKLTDWREKENEAEAILIRECAWSNKLDGVYQNIKRAPGFKQMKENDIVSIVSDQAEIFFSEEWKFCSNVEKRTLYYLAQGHHFNPKTALVMQCLMQRYLVKRDPQFMIVSESFRLFVLQAEPLKNIRQWELDSPTSNWSSLRMPLISLFLVTAGILLYNQPDIFQEITTFAAALTAGAPILLRLVTMMRSEK
ncbi:MAG: hypothetical protein KAH20_15730 [Methylococcales bacterium]|nr:hypothetical protein [Methylococcales bacterium]